MSNPMEWMTVRAYKLEDILGPRRHIFLATAQALRNMSALSRLGTLEVQSLTAESKKLYKDIVEYTQGVPYVYKLANECMVGPYGIELHMPGPGQAWLLMTKTLKKVPGLSPLAREVAILVTGGHEDAAYEVYAHSAVSKLPQEDLQEILSGKCPAHLDPQCQTAFKVATGLCNPGVLPLAIWQEAVDVLGSEAAQALVHYVGFYKYVSTILNGFDAKVPESIQST